MVGPSLPLQPSLPRALRRRISLLRGCLRCDVVWWWSFSPDGAYDSVWDSVKQMTGNTSSIIASTKSSLGVFVC